MSTTERGTGRTYNQLKRATDAARAGSKVVYVLPHMHLYTHVREMIAEHFCADVNVITSAQFTYRSGGWVRIITPRQAERQRGVLDLRYDFDHSILEILPSSPDHAVIWDAVRELEWATHI